MDALIFRIISTDEKTSFRWKKVFEKEGWPVSCHPGLGCAGAPRLGAELDLIEIEPSVCRTGQDLKAILDARRPVAAMMFGDQKTVPNGQIAAFLEAGADDFVHKGLDERVLVAKLKAHIRRILPAIQEASARCSSSCGGIEIDMQRRSVKLKVGPGKCAELCNFTQRELDILSMLIGNEKQVITRERMLEKFWGEEAINVNSECVDKHIESLRKKLGIFGKRIRTVYGSGYMFTD